VPRRQSAEERLENGRTVLAHLGSTWYKKDDTSERYDIDNEGRSYCFTPLNLTNLIVGRRLVRGDGSARES